MSSILKFLRLLFIVLFFAVPSIPAGLLFAENPSTLIADEDDEEEDDEDEEDEDELLLEEDVNDD